MDVDRFLDIERRTGIKDSDIDGFLSKVDNVQDQLAKLMSGELAPADVKIPGERTKEEEAIFQKDKARRIRERAEEAAKLKKEEHDKWWRGAELHKEYMADRLNQKVTVEIEGEIFPKQQVNKGKDCLDYSVWDKWVPDDPVSLAEMKEKVDKVDAEKNALFEKNNPDFCNNFKEDMEKREKTKVRKETDAERNRQKGNKKFKKKEYKGALKLYKEALQLTPLVIPILTNIAQAYIKLNDYDEATEYCNRALFLDEQNVKALSRRSLCFKKKNDYINALKDLETAQTIEPGNASILKELKLCKMEKAEKEAEDEVLKLVQPTLLTTAVDSESKQLKKDAADTSSDEQVKDKENSKEISVSEKAAQFLEMAVTTSNKNTNDQHNTVSDTTPPMAPAASTKTFTKSNSISEMAANSPDKNNIPFEFKLMDDAFEMYNKWWRVEGGSTSKDAAENAKLAAGSLVPLLLTNDAMRIYFRRCGFSKTLHETLIEFTTSTMDISISTTETGINQDSNTERKNERPIASSSMLVTILTVISAACRNRLVQEEFVVEFNGLNHVANVLSTAIIVDNTARATVNGGSKETQPARSKLTDISLIRACVDVIEACTTHESSIKMILNHVRNESKKKKKKKKKITLDAVDLACQIPILLLEVMHTVESNTHILRHAVDALCTLTANVQADEIVPYMSLLSTNGLNIIHVLSNILIRTTGKDSSTHPAVESCRESCSRCMTALSIHSQWRAYFCAFNAIPSLISVLKPNTVDTVAARANALAALMNGACASGDMASEVYTEIRDQIHKGGAVAWLVHLMEPKEIFTKVDVQSMNKKKEGKGNQQDVTFESNYSRVTTANQRAALVLQKRSRKSLDDHVRERSAGLLSRCASHPPVKSTLSHPSLYARLLNTFVQVCKASEDSKYIANVTRIVASCVGDSTTELCQLIVSTKVDHLLINLLNKCMPDLITKNTAPGHGEAVQIAGNACKCLISIVKDPSSKDVYDLATRGGGIKTIIDVIRSTNDPSTRKNSAIVLARLAKSKKLMVVIRELRGMEILMSLGRQIVD